MTKEGWQGWDAYAPFYDWENAQTLGRRDVPFWRRLAKRASGPVLELGRGTRTREHRFELNFRTLSVPQMTRQLTRAGFTVDAVLGDYRGRPWDDRADVWIIL